MDLGPSMGDGRWVKVAQRVSAPVVVRGRSPGHYHAERRQSNASAGGSTGPSGNGPYMPNNGLQRGPNDQLAIVGPSPIAAASAYEDSYGARSHHYLQRARIEIPMEPIMSNEEIRAIEESDGYFYYPSPIYEGTGYSLAQRSHLGALAHRDNRTLGSAYEHSGMPKIKQEPGTYSGFSLPSLTSGVPADNLGRHFGRFEGLPTSRGYYPTVFTNSEVNFSMKVDHT